MTYRNRIVLILWILVVCLILDQVTKRIAIAWLMGAAPIVFFDDLFRLQYAENTGAFLGLFGNMSATMRSVLLVGFNSIILIVVTAFLLISNKLSRMAVIALALILAGGVGNLIDRIAYGGIVVDFMNMGIPWFTLWGWEPRTGIFNIADLAIVAGLVLMVTAEFFASRQPDEKGDVGQEDTPEAN